MRKEEEEDIVVKSGMIDPIPINHTTTSSADADSEAPPPPPPPSILMSSRNPDAIFSGGGIRFLSLSLSLSLLLLLLFILYISIRLHFFFFFLVDSPWDLLSYYVIFLSGSTCIIVVYCLFLIFFLFWKCVILNIKNNIKSTFQIIYFGINSKKKKIKWCFMTRWLNWGSLWFRFMWVKVSCYCYRTGDLIQISPTPKTNWCLGLMVRGIKFYRNYKLKNIYILKII